jgi:mannan endo-1,4-beta-mannosidase
VVDDAAGNRSPRSAAVGVTTEEGGTPGVGCSAAYRVVNEWPGGFQGEIVLRNTGAAAVSGWTLVFRFADGQSVANMWGGTPAQDGGTVSVTPASYTSAIAAGGSVTLGFTATKSDANSAPTGFTLDGTACTTG